MLEQGSMPHSAKATVYMNRVKELDPVTFRQPDSTLQ